MVSRRKFFVIFLMMAVLLFLFQFSQVMRESWNYYSNNEYAYDDLPDAREAWSAQSPDLLDGNGRTVFFVGDKDNEIGKIVAQWCVYAKYKLVCSAELASYDRKQPQPVMILIDGENADEENLTANLNRYLMHGVSTVFLSLPDVSVIEKNKRLREILGISEVVKETVTVEGIRLFKGGLLGGESVYKAQDEEEAEEFQDLRLDMPWYVTDKGTKTYMVGMLDEKRYEREKFPRIIWRSCNKDGMVFAVNGDYMKDETAFGFLDLFLYEMSDYALYPVINAQNTLIVDFPDFSGADEETVAALYSRSAQAVQRDIFWPSIYSMISRNNLKPTCFFMTQYDGEVPPEVRADYVDFYLQQINEVGAEAGRSLHYGDNMTLAEKTEADSRFYQNTGCEYEFRAGYLERMDDAVAREWKKAVKNTQITTVAAMADGDWPLVSYCTDHMTLQRITHEAGEYSYSRDLRTKSLLTSLGYTNMLVDFHRVLWPKSREDSWEVYFDIIYSNISTYWTRLVLFDQTTLSESDRRVRNFLNFDYAHRRDGNMIYTVIRGGGNDCYFILRTHGEKIKEVSNGDFRQLEQDTYLIHATGSNMSIVLDDAEEILQYQGPFGR